MKLDINEINKQEWERVRSILTSDSDQAWKNVEEHESLLIMAAAGLIDRSNYPAYDRLLKICLHLVVGELGLRALRVGLGEPANGE